MPAFVKMLGRVFVFRRIAAADVTARVAQTQMNPTVAHFQTFLAAVGRVGGMIGNFFDMNAFVCHYFTSKNKKYQFSAKIQYEH